MCGEPASGTGDLPYKLYQLSEPHGSTGNIHTCICQ